MKDPLTTKDRAAVIGNLETLIDDGLASGVSASTMQEIIAEAKTRAEAEWLAENKSAIDASNKRIDEQGTLIKPIWTRKK